MSLSIGTPKNVNPDFIKHKAKFKPGPHTLTFFVDSFEVLELPFTNTELNLGGQPVFLADGP